jgi:hypothetical protein
LNGKLIVMLFVQHFLQSFTASSKRMLFTTDDCKNLTQEQYILM